MVLNETERKAAASALFDEIQDVMLCLYERWQDEREYEKIEDYGKPLITQVSLIGGEFKKMVKRPFGFIYDLAGATYQVKMTSKSYSYKRIA